SCSLPTAQAGLWPPLASPPLPVPLACTRLLPAFPVDLPSCVIRYPRSLPSPRASGNRTDSPGLWPPPVIRGVRGRGNPSINIAPLVVGEGRRLPVLLAGGLP
ncbi:unnamed protein product, partial [Ectocarpus sp. 13 AM-2016]